MINADMRFYDYYTLGNADEYGTPQISSDIVGSIKLAIYTTSQNVTDNINYRDANYIGLTKASVINDTFVIKYGEEFLKVLYIQPKGRYKQVFLKKVI